MRHLSARVADRLKTLFSKDYLDNKAKETGFIQRKGKLTALSYLQLFVLSSRNSLEESLSYQSTLLKSLYDIDISKQALDQRINEQSVLFLKSILDDLCKDKFCINTKKTHTFKDIRIKDSTQFKLPDYMKDRFPGYGGTSPSVAKIQFEYSFTSGKIYDLSITNARENDMKNANDTISNVEKDDLIIRDLGYVSTDICQQIQEKGAFFINRLKAGINLYDLNGKRLTIKSLKASLRRTSQTHLDKMVLIGSKHKFPVRLIISAVSEKDKIKRQLKHRKTLTHRKREKMNMEVFSSKGLNLFITNLSINECSADNIYKYYKIRWQIELVFKAWKSIYKIDQIKPVKTTRFLNYLYSTFIWIVLNWEAIMGVLTIQIARKDNIISLQKAFKMINTIRSCITSFLISSPLLKSFYQRTMESWIRYGKLEKRKNRLSLNDIILQINV